MDLAILGIGPKDHKMRNQQRREQTQASPAGPTWKIDIQAIKQIKRSYSRGEYNRHEPHETASNTLRTVAVDLMST